MRATSDQLLRFYEGTAPDDQGRKFDAIVLWEDRALEDVHDYVQWLFPTSSASRYNATAPLVDASVAAAFAEREELRDRHRRAFDRMLAFYGFQRTGLEIAPRTGSARWQRRTLNWLTTANHNLLRINRILQSVRELGQPELALAFYECLLDVQGTPEGKRAIPEATRRIWGQAAGDE